MKKIKPDETSTMTITDLLSSDDVKDLLKEINEEAPEIEHLVISWIKRDGTPRHSWCGSRQAIIFMIETMKHDFLNEITDFSED